MAQHSDNLDLWVDDDAWYDDAVAANRELQVARPRRNPLASVRVALGKTRGRLSAWRVRSRDLASRLRSRLRVPKLRIPALRVPALRVPALRMPALRMPALRMPALRMPALRMPALRLPALRLPALRLPSFRMPALRIPALRIPALRLPALRLPALRLPALRLPALRQQALRIPAPVTAIPMPLRRPRAIGAAAVLVALSAGAVALVDTVEDAPVVGHALPGGESDENANDGPASPDPHAAAPQAAPAGEEVIEVAEAATDAAVPAVASDQPTAGPTTAVAAAASVHPPGAGGDRAPARGLPGPTASPIANQADAPPAPAPAPAPRSATSGSGKSSVPITPASPGAARPAPNPPSPPSRARAVQPMPVTPPTAWPQKVHKPLPPGGTLREAIRDGAAQFSGRADTWAKANSRGGGPGSGTTIFGGRDDNRDKGKSTDHRGKDRRDHHEGKGKGKGDK